MAAFLCKQGSHCLLSPSQHLNYPRPIAQVFPSKMLFERDPKTIRSPLTTNSILPGRCLKNVSHFSHPFPGIWTKSKRVFIMVQHVPRPFWRELNIQIVVPLRTETGLG